MVTAEKQRVGRPTKLATAVQDQFVTGISGEASLEEVVGKRATLDHQPMQPGDVVRTYADLAHASERLGYAPKTDFKEGLAQQWEWLKTELEVSV